MEIFIRNKKIIALILTTVFALLINTLPGFAQTTPLINSTLHGVVLDSASKEPLQGAVVHIQGTTHAVNTDKNGKFDFITGQKFPYTLIITYIGYQVKKVIATGTPITIILKENVSQLNDVVVVGYGTQSRKDLTGAVSTIKVDEVRDKPEATFEQQLQGQAAGLQVSASTGIPGDGMYIRIRGTTSINAGNDPLYVVDGVYINSSSLQQLSTEGQQSNPLSDINPDDIASISVLKDADATAIYGARAANGVIVITTKRGKNNTAPKVSLSTYFGASWAPKLWDLVTGPQQAQIVNTMYANSEADAIAAGNATAIAQYKYLPFRALTDNPTASPAPRGLPQDQPTYDRLHDAFRTGFLQNYDASVSGGNDYTTYYIAGGVNTQQADLKTDDFRRSSFKINIDQKINDIFSIGTSNTLTSTYRTLARVGDGPQGGVLQAALHTPTYLPLVNADGTPAKWAGFDNLDVLLNNTNMHSTSDRLISNVYLEAKISPDLKFRSSWSIDYQNYNEFQYWNSLTNLGIANNNLGTSSITTNTVWSDENTLTYAKTIGKHTFGALIGNSLEGTTTNNTTATGSSFPNNSYETIASAAVQTASSTENEYKLSSFFARVNYNYDEKYYVDFNIRADGSSKFGANNEFGYFPAAGAAWRIKQEDFLKDVSFINDLKLRGSYGLTGNQNNINDYASRGLWGAGANYLSAPGTLPTQLANPNLKWESTRQADIGLDASFFNNRLSITSDIYDKFTSNLLINLPLPVTSGFSSILENAGQMDNKGIELSISSTNVNLEHFKWTTNFNISTNVNKIVKLPTPVIAAYAAERMVQGLPMYTFFVYKQLYVDPKTGNAVYDDAKHDGGTLTPTSSDIEADGSALPKYTGGLTNTFTYKSFDLLVAFNYEIGNKVYNNNDYFLEGGGTRDAARAIDTRQLTAWSYVGQITDMPRLTALGDNYTISPTSRNIEDGSFLRLSNANLGYRLPKSLTEKVKISSVRVYVSGTNLWLLTKYRGPDPEINVSSSPTVLGYDLGTPPIPRTIQVGANITF
jgi:TonB-dependent starch-binding outer membrane protein SusC